MRRTTTTAARICFLLNDWPLEDNKVVELGLLAEKAMEKGTLVVRIPVDRTVNSRWLHLSDPAVEHARLNAALSKKYEEY